MEDDENDEESPQQLDLPHDLITVQILTKLSIKHVLQFKCVSKQWYSTLTSPHFGYAHFNISPFYRRRHLSPGVIVQCGNKYSFISSDYDDDNGEVDGHITHIGFDGPRDVTFLLGSCNGLVCLVSLTSCLIIWNPIINECAKFSCSFDSLDEDSDNIAWGFGYVSSLDDYKVVRLVEPGDSNVIICHIFSLRSKKWEQIHDPMLSECSLGRARPKRLVGVLANEILYWIVDEQNGGHGQDILGFDLEHERFNKMKCLILGDTYLGEISFLCVMGGYLSMCRFTNRGDVSISILKQHGQVEYIGLYRSLELSSCNALVGFTNGGEFFIKLGNQELGLVDPNSSPKMYTRVVTFDGEGETCVASYVPSLISPLHMPDL